MRICHLITTLVYGGAERLLVEVCNWQAKSHSIDLVYLKCEPHLQSALDPSIRVTRIDLDLRCVGRVRAFLKETKPDILHTHLGHADLIGMWASRGLRIKRCCTIHSIWTTQSRKDHLISLAYRVLFRTVASESRVVAISGAVGDHVRRNFGVPEARISVIRNGIPDLPAPLERSECRTRLGIPEDVRCVLFLGRFHVQKSLDTLISSLPAVRAEIPRLLVLIVGSGPEEKKLKDMVLRLGLSDYVEFRGNTSEPESYFHAADLFVLPSITEGLGLVILEAFRAGTPVLATDIEGPKELIRDGENGELVPPRNPARMAAGITSMLRDSSKLGKYGKAGRKTFQADFTLGKYMSRLDAFYQGL